MSRTETFTLSKTKKEGLASTMIGHVEKEYDILSDGLDEDGVRIIKLKPKDLTEQRKKQNEIVDAIMEKLGESGKTLKAILGDTLKDYNKTSIDRIYKKIVLGEEPVRAGRGCYYIAIGDGRKKTSDIIRIRD